MPPCLAGQLQGTMPSATFGIPADIEPSYPMPLTTSTTSTPLAPVQPPYLMPPAAPSHSPLVPHRLHVAPTAPAALSLNSSTG